MAPLFSLYMKSFSAMGTVIKSISHKNSGGSGVNIDMLTHAGKDCLKSAGVHPKDLGMLIYAGVYSENLLKEPAAATLVHRKLCVGSWGVGCSSGKQNVLCFDLHNGEGGIMQAIQVVDGFIQSGEIDYGLVVSGDVVPKIGRNISYFYADEAGAILLGRDSDVSGFTAFAYKTFSEYDESLTSIASWDDMGLILKIKKDWNHDSIKCACVKEMLDSFEAAENGFDLLKIDMIVASPGLQKLKEILSPEIGRKCFQQEKNVAESYSSGLLRVLNGAIVSEEFSMAESILLIHAGAGIHTSMSIYTK